MTPQRQIRSAFLSALDLNGSVFLRDNATLALIIITDEDDQSNGTVEDYYSAFAGFKSDPALFIPVGIFPRLYYADKVYNWLYGCLDNPRLDAFMSLAGDAGIYANLCLGNFAGKLKLIGSILAQSICAFPLVHAPTDPSQIAVRVGGQTIPADHFNVAAPAIPNLPWVLGFATGYCPEPNAAIEVSEWACMP